MSSYATHVCIHACSTVRKLRNYRWISIRTCVTPRSIAKESTHKTATEFGGEGAVLFLTLLLRSSDRVSGENVKTRNITISRTSKRPKCPSTAPGSRFCTMPDPSLYESQTEQYCVYVRAGRDMAHDCTNCILEGQHLCSNQDTCHKGVVKYHPACPSTSAQLPHLYFY